LKLPKFGLRKRLVLGSLAMNRLNQFHHAWRLPFQIIKGLFAATRHLACRILWTATSRRASNSESAALSNKFGSRFVYRHMLSATLEHLRTTSK
jgi:hypothetical protein